MATATTSIGAVQFQIPRGSLAAGETARFDCQIQPQERIYGVGMHVYVEGVAGYQIFQAQGSVGAGEAGRVCVDVTLDASRLAQMSGRGGAMTAAFHLYINPEMTNSMASDAVDLGMTALKSRLAPAVGAVTFSDSTGAKARFGSFVQGKSQIGVSAAASTDPLASDVTLVSRTLALGGETFDLNKSASLGAPRASGEIAWTLTVVDSAGLSGTASGTIDALPYAPPEIASLSAERYRAVVADDGTTSYVAANDGERVRFSLEASVCPVAAQNAWTLKVVHGGAEATVLSGTDGEAISLEDDRSVVASVVPAGERRTFEFVLEDFFESARAIVSVEKASAYFNIEPHGLGVGMYAQGTPDNPAMDVAWPIRPHAGARSDSFLSWKINPLTSAGQGSVTAPRNTTVYFGEYTVEQSGLYYLWYQTWAQPGEYNKTFVLFLDSAENGEMAVRGEATSNVTVMCVAGVFSLSAGDTIKGRIFHNCTDTQSVGTKFGVLLLTAA